MFLGLVDAIALRFRRTGTVVITGTGLHRIIMSEGLLHACISSYNISLMHAYLCFATDLLLLNQILQNRPTQSRKNKIIAQIFTTGINLRTDEILF